MYYFVDFSNSDEFSIYLLTPEQGTDIVAMCSGDAIFISYKDTSKKGCVYNRVFRKGGI